MSSLAWLDFSESDRQKALDVIDLFREKGTVDELGIGTVRDSFADLLFPGTSTIMTRARYYLFVPWIYQRHEQKKTPSNEITHAARKDEIALVEALAKSEDIKGVIGIEARTSNAQEMKGEGVIAKQWQKFFQDGVQQKIANRADANLYAVYSDYASDRNGEFSFVIGVRVNTGATVPAGMVLKKIPAGDYALITSEKGPVGKVVVAAWQQVWSLEDKAQLARAYKADFEVYDRRAADPENSQVELYVGLK